MGGIKKFDLGSILERVEQELESFGVAVDLGVGAFADSSEGTKVKVVCVTPGLRKAVEEMGKSPRDQVVMVRVDSETSASLDSWVATGAVKSRSEAAALFIREGLAVRSDELAKLEDALKEVEDARERLREKAREVFGHEDGTSAAPDE